MRPLEGDTSGRCFRIACAGLLPALGGARPPKGRQSVVFRAGRPRRSDSPKVQKRVLLEELSPSLCGPRWARFRQTRPFFTNGSFHWVAPPPAGRTLWCSATTRVKVGVGRGGGVTDASETRVKVNILRTNFGCFHVPFMDFTVEQ